MKSGPRRVVESLHPADSLSVKRRGEVEAREERRGEEKRGEEKGGESLLSLHQVTRRMRNTVHKSTLGQGEKPKSAKTSNMDAWWNTNTDSESDSCLMHSGLNKTD